LFKGGAAAHQDVSDVVHNEFSRSLGFDEGNTADADRRREVEKHL
jgi:hypothetical protein